MGIQKIDPSLLRQYLERWQAVEAVEREERRAATMTQKWQELNYLHLLAESLGLIKVEHGEEAVWLRWAILKGKN